jgi:hypothetical protein
MSRKKSPPAAKKRPAQLASPGGFDSLVSSIVHIHRETQAFASRAVNVSVTLRNWLIGHRIVVFEQEGAE